MNSYKSPFTYYSITIIATAIGFVNLYYHKRYIKVFADNAISVHIIHNESTTDLVVTHMIGERIKDARELNGFTQSALAKKLGISRSAVNAWEMGISVPSAQYLIALSKLFNISSDYLLELDPKETVDISSLTHEEKQIIYFLLNYYKKYGDTLRKFNEQVKTNYSAIKEVSEEITNQPIKNILEEVMSLNEMLE